MASGKKDGALMRHSAIKIRLLPTQEQAALLDKTFGCCRYLWNQMLADEREFYAASGQHFIPAPARYKKSAPFLKEVDSQALVTVHQNLIKAFKRFFENPECYGYPAFKRKKSGRNSYTVYCQYYKSGNGSSIYLTKNGVRLPKLGIVRARVHRRPLHWWTLKSATVSRTPSGKYECALMFAYPVKAREPVRPAPERTLGLHYSLSRFYVDSEGHAAQAPHWLQESEGRLAEWQSRLSRMERGSKRYQKQLLRIQRLHEHIANQRRDFVHKESRRIANAWDAVCVRSDGLREMSRALPLGNVMDSGFGKFRACLEYKLAWQGKPLIAVDKYFPAAKACHCCGSVNDSLTLRERVWICPSCGAVLPRETNAAKNLKACGLAQICA